MQALTPDTQVTASHDQSLVLVSSVNVLKLLRLRDSAVFTINEDVSMQVERHIGEDVEEYEAPLEDEPTMDAEEPQGSRAGLRYRTVSLAKQVRAESQRSSRASQANEPKLEISAGQVSDTLLRAACWSPDNQYLFTCSNDKVLRMFYIDSNQCIATCRYRRMMPKRMSHCLTLVDESTPTKFEIIISDRVGDFYRCTYQIESNTFQCEFLAGHNSVATCAYIWRAPPRAHPAAASSSADASITARPVPPLLITADADSRLRLSYWPRCYQIYGYVFGLRRFSFATSIVELVDSAHPNQRHLGLIHDICTLSSSHFTIYQSLSLIRMSSSYGVALIAPPPRFRLHAMSFTDWSFQPISPSVPPR